MGLSYRLVRVIHYQKEFHPVLETFIERYVNVLT
jgi:hypothetical protein